MELVNGKYSIQGIDLKDICSEYGTPLYVYNADVIERQLKSFTNAFSQINCKVKYACKANSNLSILKEMLSHGTGLDTVSIPEIKVLPTRRSLSWFAKLFSSMFSSSS